MEKNKEAIAMTEEFEHVEPQASVPLSTNPEQIPVESTELADQYVEKTAGFWMRFWAFSIDSLLVLAIVGLLVNPIFYIMDWDLSGNVWYAPISILSAVIYYAYFVIMTYYWKQTVGKMIFGLRVVSIKEEKLSFTSVLFREWIGRLICNAVTPLYLLVVIMPKNQGLHDYFADTTVIQENVFSKLKDQPVASKPTVIEENPQSAY